MKSPKRKNINKEMSYRLAHSRIKKAIQNHYYLEAITIQESILSDRIISLAFENKLFTIHEYEVHKNLTLGNLIGRMKNSAVNDNPAIASLVAFNDKRNECIHSMVKSFPGKATKSITEFKTNSIEACKLGNTAIKNVKSLQSDLRKINKKVQAK